MTAMILSSARSSNDRVGVSARQSQWRREINSLPALRPGRIGVGWSRIKTRQTPRDCREPHEQVACKAENTSLAQSGSPDLDTTKLKAALGSFAVVLRKFCVAAAFLAVTNKVLRGQGLNTLAFLGIQVVVPVLIFKKLIKFSSFEALAATLAIIPSFWAAVARFVPAHHMTLTDVHFSARFMLPATVVETATSSNFLGKGVGFLTASFPGTGLARWVYILTWLVISAFAYTSLKLRCWNPAKWAQVQHPEPPQSSNGDRSTAEAQEEIARLRQQVHDLQLSSQAGSVHQDGDKTRSEGGTAATSDSSPSKEVSVPGPPATASDTNVDDDEGDGWSTVAEFQVDTDDGPQPVPQAKANDPAEAVKPSIPAEMPPTASPPLILGLGLGSLGATEVSSSDDDADDEVYKAWVESAMEKEMWAVKEELKEELRDDLYLEVEAVRETMETHLKNLPSRSFCARGDGAKHEFRLTDLKADLVKLQQTADISAPLKEMTSSIATLVDGFTTQETEARKKAVSELSERVNENDLINEVLRSNLRDMEVQHDALEQRVVELTEQLKDSAESHSRHLSLQSDSLENQIRALKEQVRSSEDLLKNQQYQMDTLSSDLDAFQEQRLAMDLVVEERLDTAQETEQQAQQAINAIEPPTPESDLGQLLLDGLPTQAEKTWDEYKKRTQEERPAYQLRNAARRGHAFNLEPHFVHEEQDRPHQPSDPTESSEEDEPVSGDAAKVADTPVAASSHKPKGDAEAWAPPADAGAEAVEGHSAHVASDDTEAQALKEIYSLNTADSPPAADQEKLETFEVVIEVQDRLPAKKDSDLFKTARAEGLPSLHARPVHEKPTPSDDNIINIRTPSKMVDPQLFPSIVEPEPELSSWHLEVSPINDLPVPITKPPQQTSVELDIHFIENPPAFKDSWISKRADVEDSGYDEDDDYSSDKTTDSDDCFQAKYGWHEDDEYSDQEDSDKSEETDGAETEKSEENSSEDDSDKDEDNEVELVWISDSDRSDEEETGSEDEDDDDDLNWIKHRS